IEAARALGVRHLRTAFRHILPNTVGPFIVLCTAQLGSAILVEATLSFLGMGIPEPYPSWGRMLSVSAAEYAQKAPHLVLFPGIDKVNPRLNAFVLINADQARREAKSAERAVGKRGARLGPLHGVPFGVKDLVVTRGVRTTFGTPLYRDNVPTEDAPMVERLKRAGAILLGKTNTPTFGWLGATHNLVFGPTRNPWDLERTPGGSSGGASAAAAAGLGP